MFFERFLCVRYGVECLDLLFYLLFILFREDYCYLRIFFVFKFEVWFVEVWIFEYLYVLVFIGIFCFLCGIFLIIS